MVLKFYYSPSSPPSKAVWMLLEEMGIEYEAHEIDLFKGEHKKPEYKAINPLCQVPAIVDGDFQLWESRAVLQYLASKYGGASSPFYPKDLKQRATVDKILYSDGSAYEGKIQAYLNIGGVFQGKGLAMDKLDDLKSALEMYNTYLDGKTGFMVGDHLTIADLCCFNSLYVLSYTGFKDWDKYPNVHSWYENTIQKLKSYKTCIQDPVDAFGKMYRDALKQSQDQVQE